MAVPDLSEAGRLVGEDLSYQRRVWRAQRLGWAAMGLAIVAALAGTFGDGPLADGRAVLPGGAELRYERIERAGRDSRMVLEILGAAHASALRLEGSFVEAAEIVAVTPPEALTARGPDRLLLRVPPVPGGRAAVVLRTRAHSPGLFRATLADGAREVSFRVLILP